MTHQKRMWQTMAVLGGLAIGLSLFPTPTKAEMSPDNSVSPAPSDNSTGSSFDRTLSPAPSNNPTRANTVNGTTIPVWTIDESLQITLPSQPINTLSSDRASSMTGSDMNASSVWIPSGLGRRSGNTGGPTFDPLPGTRIEYDTPSGSNVSGTTPNPNPTIERRTIDRTDTTSPTGTTQDNQNITVPNDRTNTTPMNPDGSTRIERTNPTGTNVPGTTVPDGTENQDMQMQMQMETNPSSIPSGQGRSGGSTPEPSRDPLPGQ